ncbi:MAG: HD domain-containing protein [Bacteroidia bacterium]
MKLNGLLNMFCKYAALDLLSMDINPDNIDEVLKQIDSEIETITGKKEDLLQKMNDIIHSADDYHKGESILEHTKEVLQNIENMADEITGINDNALKLLRLVALFHDIGKVYTFAITKKNDKTKHTFYSHAAKSVEVLKLLISKDLAEDSNFHHDLTELVKAHNSMMDLLASKKGDDPAYVKRLVESTIGKRDLIKQLNIFMKADSMTEHAMKETLKTINSITEDVPRYHTQLKEKENRAAAIDQMIVDKKDEVEELLNIELPNDTNRLMALYPNIGQIRGEIMKAKRKDILGKLNIIIPVR